MQEILILLWPAINSLCLELKCFELYVIKGHDIDQPA